MSKGPGSGDKLARGAVSAKFSTTEGGVSQEKWDAAFNFDPEVYKNVAEKSKLRSAPEEDTEPKEVAHFPNSD